MTPDIQTLYDVVDGTWPAAAFHREGPWTIREGQGGGQRVSAATATEPVTESDIPRAEAAMRSSAARLISTEEGRRESLRDCVVCAWSVCARCGSEAFVSWRRLMHVPRNGPTRIEIISGKLRMCFGQMILGYTTWNRSSFLWIVSFDRLW